MLLKMMVILHQISLRVLRLLRPGLKVRIRVSAASASTNSSLESFTVKKSFNIASASADEDQHNSNKFADANIKVSRQPDSDPKMHIHRRKSAASQPYDDDDTIEIDPELHYCFQRNFKIQGLNLLRPRPRSEREFLLSIPAGATAICAKKFGTPPFSTATVPVLERGPDHALEAFSGHMQLRDTYSMLGQV